MDKAVPGQQTVHTKAEAPDGEAVEVSRARARTTSTVESVATNENLGNDVGGDEDPLKGDEQDGDDDIDADKNVEWDELYACPLLVRFTQEKIHPFFYRRGPIVNVLPSIRAVMHTDDDVIELVPPFSPIHCLRKGDELWSLDNRRLYALQLAAMDQWPRMCRVRLLCCERLPRGKLKTQWRKFQTTSEGRMISVCARYQQFDAWNWFERAIELELYSFSLRIGTVLSIFEVAPVVGALLFRTGLTGFSSRIPLMVGFAMTFGVDFLRQKVPIFERRICELHVKAVMEGDVRQLHPCWRRLRLGGEQQEDGKDNEEVIISSPQLAAITASVLVLLLPYVVGAAQDRIRVSLLSCWLGVACVLAVQLTAALRGRGDVESEYTGAGQRLTPKGRWRGPAAEDEPGEAKESSE